MLRTLLRPLLLGLAAVSAWQPAPRAPRLAPARAAVGDGDGPFVVLRVQFDASVSEVRVRDDIISSFPFAAALPVQPLKTEPTETGLRLLFRRKPTATKSSIDGGLDFRVDAPSAGAGPILFVTRITDGATWTKLISEKLVSARARARACALCLVREAAASLWQLCKAFLAHIERTAEDGDHGVTSVFYEHMASP